MAGGRREQRTLQRAVPSQEGASGVRQEQQSLATRIAAVAAAPNPLARSLLPDPLSRPLSLCASTPAPQQAAASSSSKPSACPPSLSTSSRRYARLEGPRGESAEARTPAGAAATRRFSLNMPHPGRISIHQRPARCVASYEPVGIPAMDQHTQHLG